MKIFTPLTLALALVSGFFYAQDKPESIIKLNDKIESVTVNDVSGIAVVEGNKKIYGISSTSKTPVWSFDISEFINNSLSASDISNFKLSNELEVDVIYGSKFVILTKGLSKSIVNSETGEIVFSSKKSEVSPIEHQMVNNTPIILVTYLKDNKVSTTAIDLNLGKILWDTEIAEKSKIFDKIASFLNAKDEQLNPSPIIDKDKNIYAFLRGSLVKFNQDGSLAWKVEKNGISNFDINKSDSNLVLLSSGKGLGGLIGLKQTLDIIDTNTGNSTLKEPLQVKTVVYLEDLGNEFILGSYSGTNLYKYSDGKPQWKKDVKGDPKMMVKSEGGYVFVTKNDMNFIDVNGKELWKRDVEISDNKDDEIIELNEKDGKIFYITSTYANIVNKATGEKIWKRNLKLDEKRPTFFTYNDNTSEYIVYNDEKLFKYGENTTERPEEFAKVNIKKEKEVDNIEIRKSGYLITGIGEIVLVDNSGKVIYQKMYQEPGAAGRRWSRVGLQALAVGASFATSTVTYQGQTSGLFLNESGRETASQINQSAFALDQKMSKRYNASKQTKDFKFYFAKEGDKKVLIKVNKDNGDEEKKFLFQDNKPKYSLDDYDKTLYYANGEEINVFKY